MLLIILIVLIVGIGGYFLYKTLVHIPRYHPGGPYYYSWVGLYTWPPNPDSKSEISLEEAKKREAYYEVYFDEIGRLISIEHVLPNEKSQSKWKKKIKYDSDGKPIEVSD